MGMNLRDVVLLCAGTLVLPGCGSEVELGNVHGIVTIDDQPLPDAMVVFHPLRGGSPSFAVTDTAGKYTLQFSRSQTGAVVGEHRVEIFTFRDSNPDAEPATERVAERVPTKYNVQSELVTQVESGDNERDFPLSSQGAIVQPDQIPQGD
jgi:hypothetical protein